jgi:hypothetical protein
MTLIMRNYLIVGLFALCLLSAGCLEPITGINIAEPIDSLAGKAGVSQRQGFGPIPSSPTTEATRSIVRINVDLPTLQPDITVLRLPPTGLDTIQFQNLTSAIGMPVGLIGERVQNLDYSFAWTNSAGEVWEYISELRRLSYANVLNSPTQPLVDAWPSEEQIIDAFRAFMYDHGIDPLSYNNPGIETSWREWKNKIDKDIACVTDTDINLFRQITTPQSTMSAKPVSASTNNCVTKQFPSRIPVTYNLIIDERNVLDKDGQAQIGGFLIMNAQTLKIEYGWITLSANPVRSDYPAISAEEMRKNLLNGGLGGKIAGTMDINEVFFAFYRLNDESSYDYQYLVPALIGSGTQTLDGAKIPYNIVVPLTK